MPDPFFQNALRVSTLTNDTVLRDRLLTRLLDAESAPRAAPESIQTDESRLVTLREVMAFTLSMVDLPYDMHSPIPTRGHVARRAYRLFRGAKFMKGSERAIMADDVDQLFDNILHVLRATPRRCLTTAMLATLAGSKDAVVQRFAPRG